MSSRSSRDSTLKAGIGYTVANVLIRGIGFLTLPIFSRLLEPTDFGIYNVFIAWDAILFVVVGLALHSSVKSANWEFPGKIDDFISSISIVYLINMAVLLIMACLFGDALASILGFEATVTVCLVVHSFGSALTTLYNARVSLQYSYKKYMVVAACSSLGNIALSLLLVLTVFNSQRYLGRVLGATIAVGLVGLFIVVGFWRKARPKVNLGYWKFGLRYSVPIVPHGLSQIVLSQFDRLMINYMVSAAAAGIYSLGANLMVIVTVLTDSVGTVWSTWFYETMEGEKADEASGAKELSKEQLAERVRAIQSRANQLMLGFAFLTVGMMMLVPELIWLLGGDEYMGGAYSAFGMILSGYCVFTYNLIVVGEYYKQQTKAIMVGTMGAAVINVVLNYFCISSFGYTAAAYTTLFSYVCYVVFHWYICRKVIGFSVLSLKKTAFLYVLLGAYCAVGLVFVWTPVVRVAVGTLVCCALLAVLLKQSGGVTGLKSLIGR